MNLIRNNTPFEKYGNIIVKREDLCSPFPGPSFSKVRGVKEKLDKLKIEFIDIKTIGVVDTFHSKAGWGVAWLCKHKGFKCIVFYPKYKKEKEVRLFQKICRDDFDAEIVPIKATKSAVLYYMAKKIMKEKYGYSFYMMPNGLRLDETISATAKEVENFTLTKYLSYDWIISISSGTIAKGVIKGLYNLNFRGKIFLHMGYSRSIENMKKYISNNGDINLKIEIIDEKYEYKDFVKYDCPFPCNPYYDLKAWKWLQENKKNLRLPMVFWNIGA